MVIMKKWLVLISLIAINFVEQYTPEVKIMQGVVRGRIGDDGKYFEFLGIPYGSVNSKNRFQAPGPPPTWKGTLNAIEEYSRCLQNLGFIVIGEENCLKVNIYTPSYRHHNRLLPVMVFIHGGGFEENSATNMIYGPKYLVKYGIVLVTFNYRLGVLGFLSLNIREAPGNAGLKDQVAALGWVKDNIAAFGGNPNRVTVFGESAGAVSLSYLILSPSTRGLFQRAILQSGSSLAPWALMRDPLKMAKLLAKELGFESEDPRELYRFFMKIPAKKLVSTKVKKPLDDLLSTRLVFVPTVEKEFDGIERIVLDLPTNLIRTKMYNKVPIIIGFNDKEGYFMMHKEGIEKSKHKSLLHLFMNDLDFESEQDKTEISNLLKLYYYGDTSSKCIENSDESLTEVYSDLFFKIPALFETILTLEANQTVYNYVFKYDGNRNLMKWLTGYWQSPGATHADELFYLFRTKLLFLPLTFGDKAMIQTMTTMWTNFAKYGNPTPNYNDRESWTPSTVDDLKFLTLDSKRYMGPNPAENSLTMWSKVYAGRLKNTLTWHDNLSLTRNESYKQGCDSAFFSSCYDIITGYNHVTMEFIDQNEFLISQLSPSWIRGQRAAS